MARCSSLRASISCLRAFRSSDWGKPGPPGIVKNRKASRMPSRKRIPFMVTRVTENDWPLLLFEGLLEDPIPLVSRGRLLIDHATLGHRPGRAVTRPQRSGLPEESQGLAPDLLAIRFQTCAVRPQRLVLLQGEGCTELGQELIDPHRLPSSDHPDLVDLAQQERSLDHTSCVLPNEDLSPVDLIQPFEAGAEVHLVPKNAIGEPVPGAQVAHQHRARIDPGAGSEARAAGVRPL